MVSVPACRTPHSIQQTLVGGCGGIGTRKVLTSSFWRLRTGGRSESVRAIARWSLFAPACELCDWPRRRVCWPRSRKPAPRVLRFIAGCEAYERDGIADLLEESRRPQRFRWTVPSWVDSVVIAIRLNTYWNSSGSLLRWGGVRLATSATSTLTSCFASLAAAGERCLASRDRAMSAPSRMSSGTSTSKAPSSSTSKALATSRPGLSAWSTITLDLCSAYASTPMPSSLPS